MSDRLNALYQAEARPQRDMSVRERIVTDLVAGLLASGVSQAQFEDLHRLRAEAFEAIQKEAARELARGEERRHPQEVTPHWRLVTRSDEELAADASMRLVQNATAIGHALIAHLAATRPERPQQTEEDRLLERLKADGAAQGLRFTVEGRGVYQHPEDRPDVCSEYWEEGSLAESLRAAIGELAVRVKKARERRG